MGRISSEKIDEIRNSVNIVHYISQFVNLKKAGANYKGLCPFHTEKTPSFMVSPSKQIFHCFGCGRGGNVFTFIMEYEKLSFIEAVRRAADFAGIALPQTDFVQDEKEKTYFQKLYEINETASAFFEARLFDSANKKQLEYFRKRGLSDFTIKKFRLGYAPDANNKLLDYLKSKQIDLNEAQKLGLIAPSQTGNGFYDKFRHRVMFPFQNLSGRIIGFGGRRLREQQQPKYLNSPESPIYKKGSTLYGLHQAIQSIREKGFVVIVEGYFDLLQLVENGLHNVVASSGTALTSQQAKLLLRYTKRALLLYDGDSAGRSAALRNAYILESNGLNASIGLLPPEEDPDTFVQKNGIKALNPYLESKLSPVEFELNLFNEENPQPSMEEKNRLLQELLEKLVDINDPIKIGLYLPLISQRLTMNEEMLVEQFRRLQKRRQRMERQREKRTEEKQKAEEGAGEIAIRQGQYQAEAGVIYLLLNGDQSIRNYLLQHLSHDLFDNPKFIQLYEAIINELEETGNVEEAVIANLFQDDPEIQAVLSELALSEFNDLEKLARDCIFQLKRWRLEKEAEELSTLIHSDSESTDALLHYSMELTRVRKQIHELVKEHRNNKGLEG